MILFFWFRRVRKTDAGVLYWRGLVNGGFYGWPSKNAPTKHCRTSINWTCSIHDTSSTKHGRVNVRSKAEWGNWGNRFRDLSEKLIIESSFFTELLNFFDAVRIEGYLCFMNIDSFNVVFKLDWTMNLNLFISADNPSWFYLLSLRSFKCSLDLVIRKFAEKMITKPKGTNGGTGTRRIHIGHRASVPHMFF